MLKTILVTLIKYKEKILSVLIAVAIIATAMYVSHLRKEISNLKQTNMSLNAIIASNEVSIASLNTELHSKDIIINNLNSSLHSCQVLTAERQEDQRKIDAIMDTRPSHQSCVIPVSNNPQSRKKVNRDVYAKGIDFINDQFDLIN